MVSRSSVCGMPSRINSVTTEAFLIAVMKSDLEKGSGTLKSEHQYQIIKLFADEHIGCVFNQQQPAFLWMAGSILKISCIKKRIFYSQSIHLLEGMSWEADGCLWQDQKFWDLFKIHFQVKLETTLQFNSWIHSFQAHLYFEISQYLWEANSHYALPSEN